MHRPPPPVASATPDVNIYTSAPFLAVVAKVYFPGRPWRVQDHVIGGQLFRLLHVEGQGPVVDQTFIDLHEPVGKAPTHGDKHPGLPRLVAAGTPEPIARHLARHDAAESEGAPLVMWSGFATWADYERQVLTHHADAEDRRRRRRLHEKHGPVRFEVDDAEADVLPTCITWKSERDRSLGRADLFASATHRQFFEAMRETGLLRASTLRAADGELLAIWLGAVHRRRWSGWVFAFNPDRRYAKYSPGRQLLFHMLQESHGAGHTEFDFSIGMEAYKLNYATHVRPIGAVGATTVREQIRRAVRQWLQRNPWCQDLLIRLRSWLGPAGTPT